MKVVISSTGKTLDDLVHPHFGGAKYLLVVDTDSGGVRVVDNAEHGETMEGAEVQAARSVVVLSPEYLITGHCGPTAIAILMAEGIKVIAGARGTVREAIEQLKRGDLRTAS